MWLQRSYIRCQALGWHCPKPDHSCIEELWGNSPGFTEPSQPLQKNNFGSKFPGSLCFRKLIAKLHIHCHHHHHGGAPTLGKHDQWSWPGGLAGGPAVYTGQQSRNMASYKSLTSYKSYKATYKRSRFLVNSSTTLSASLSTFSIIGRQENIWNCNFIVNIFCYGQTNSQELPFISYDGGWCIAGKVFYRRWRLAGSEV